MNIDYNGEERTKILIGAYNQYEKNKEKYYMLEQASALINGKVNFNQEIIDKKSNSIFYLRKVYKLLSENLRLCEQNIKLIDIKERLLLNNVSILELINMKGK